MTKQDFQLIADTVRDSAPLPYDTAETRGGERTCRSCQTPQARRKRARSKRGFVVASLSANRSASARCCVLESPVMTRHGFNVIETSLPPSGTLNEYRVSRPAAQHTGPLAAIAATSRAVLAATHFRAHGCLPAWARPEVSDA